jgi:hypothetical protein
MQFVEQGGDLINDTTGETVGKAFTESMPIKRLLNGPFDVNSNIELEKQDKQSFINIVYKTGGPLPTLYFVAENTGNFIQEVVKVVEGY